MKETKDFYFSAQNWEKQWTLDKIRAPVMKYFALCAYVCVCTYIYIYIYIVTNYVYIIEEKIISFYIFLYISMIHLLLIIQ